MSLASMATVAVSLLVLSVMALLALNLKYATSTVEQQVEIRAYLCTAQVPNTKCPKDELKEDQKQAIVDKVKKVPGVKNAAFVSRDQALEEMKKQFGPQKDILDDLDGENPLRDSVKIQALDTNQVKVIAEAVLKIPGISDANYGQEYVDLLLAFNRAVNIGGAGLVLLLIIATVLTVSNTIRLAVYARRREISIMKLVGATDWFIRRPFMMEGIFLGVVGALLAMALTGYGYDRITTYVNLNIPFLPMRPPGEVLGNLTLALSLLGGALGGLGSLVSLRRFLKV
jgi:cell division transport system permease protein